MNLTHSVNINDKMKDINKYLPLNYSRLTVIFLSFFDEQQTYILMSLCNNFPILLPKLRSTHLRILIKSPVNIVAFYTFSCFYK